ncbi:MAG TPA: hypothetical protein VGS06_44590 [Streptosporangiaceae bacterium]|nr:hypothetical protein [Streptosporangiaceae bacterium]
MLSKSTFAGSFALLAAPIVVVAATLAQPTLSDGAAKQVAALTDHRSAAIAGMALNLIAVVLLIAGTVWLALALAQHAPRLAMAGGVLGVLGTLVVLFEDSVAAAAPSIVSRLGRAQATAVIHSIRSNAAVSAIDLLSALGIIGIILLGIAVVQAGAPRWAAAAIAVGALGEAAGFATATKAPLITGAAFMFAGLLQAVRTLVVRPRRPPAAQIAEAAAAS